MASKKRTAEETDPIVDGPDADEEASHVDKKPKITSTVSKKRGAPADTDDAQPPAKKARADDDDDAQGEKRSAADAGLDDSSAPSSKSVAKKQKTPSAAAAAAVPIPTTKEQARSPYIFYPDCYDKLDPQKITFSKDPITSRDKSGDMVFMSYLFDDGTEKKLMVQTPNAMFSPTGVTTWKDGNFSILLSCGKNWSEDPMMSAFRAVNDKIQKRCIEMVCEKKWNGSGSHDPETLQDSFSDIVFVGENKETGEPYPPSIKLSVNINGSDATELFEKVQTEEGGSVMTCILPTDVTKGCGVTGIINYAWVFRKKAKKGFSFSSRTNLFQGRVFPPSSVGCIDRNACAIQD
jgi:hypothetical protein